MAPLNDTMRDLLDRIESPAVRWALVAVGVIILLRLRLILFAAALPVLAYWHYSNQQEEPQDGQQQGQEAADDGYEDEGCEGQGGGGAWKDDDDLGLGNGRDLQGGEDVDPYDHSFWSQGDNDAGKGGGRDGKSGHGKNGDTPAGLDDDNDFGLGGGFDFGLGGGGGGAGGGGPKTGSGANAGGGFLDDFDFGFGGGKGGGGGGDFMGGGGDDDMFGGFGGKGKGGKGGKGKKDGGKDGPREPNPRQVFVAGIGDLPEDEIRMFFEEVGEVERLKILTHPDTGQSKGVCFVTFREESQAKEAIKLHGTPLDGKPITVRPTNGGNKGDKGGSKGGGGGFGGGGGGFGGGDRDRGARGGFGGDRGEERSLDLGGSERFGAAFGFGGGGGDRDRDGGGKGKGKGKGGGKRDRGELDELLEEALSEGDGPLRPSDFDFIAKRFLGELRNRDKAEGTGRFGEAMEMVLKYTCSKDRSSVRNWRAYVFTLLQKFDPALYDELRERDVEKRQMKGGGGRGGGRDRDD